MSLGQDPTPEKMYIGYLPIPRTEEIICPITGKTFLSFSRRIILLLAYAIGIEDYIKNYSFIFADPKYKREKWGYTILDRIKEKLSIMQDAYWLANRISYLTGAPPEAVFEWFSDIIRLHEETGAEI